MGPHAAPNEPRSPFPSFVALYDEHVEELYRFVHRRCRDHGLAEDITQDTFMTALRDHDLDEISMAWLKRVARNRLVDVLRRQSNYVTKLRLVGQGSADAAEVDIAERLRVEGALDELTSRFLPHVVRVRRRTSLPLFGNASLPSPTPHSEAASPWSQNLKSNH